MLSNNTFMCIRGDIFGLMGNFFKMSVFNILTGEKRDMTELKLVWPVNTTGHHSKIILSPDNIYRLDKQSLQDTPATCTLPRKQKTR